jgi:hypothetical protein
MFMITEANIDPTAMVEAKSKLDILAKVRRPDIRVINIMMLNIKSTDKKTIAIVDHVSNIQFCIIVVLN